MRQETKGRRKPFTLLQDGTICIDRLVNDGLTVSCLCHLLTLHADLLPLWRHK